MPRINLSTIDEEVWSEVYPENREWVRDVFISNDVEMLIRQVNYDYFDYELRMKTRKHYEKLEVENYLKNLFE